MLPAVSDKTPFSLDASTRYCAVYGHPIGHSASPAMQNAGLDKLGLNWRYLAFDVHPDNLAAALAGAKAMQFIGLNLTVPHKLLALDLVDELDESARVWGAVNTVRFERRDATGEWAPLRSSRPDDPGPVRSKGFNTDAGAVVRSIREDLGMSLKRADVLLLGAGGAGRVAALKLASEGVKTLWLVNRTVEKAEAIAREIAQKFPNVRASVGYPVDKIDLVLNATSLGLKPADPLPFAPASFALARATAAYDMVYRPAETQFLQQAAAAGCKIANGLGMLLHQGAEALEIWTGERAPVAEMRAALEKNIYGRQLSAQTGVQRA